MDAGPDKWAVKTSEALLLAAIEGPCADMTAWEAVGPLPRRASMKSFAWRSHTVFICRDKYMLCGVCQWSGICVRNHCGAEPPRDIEPPGLVTTVGWRDRESASYAAADRVKAPASAARGRFRGIQGGRTAPSLSTEARTASGGGCLAGSVPPVLVRSRRCSRAPPRAHGSVNTDEKEDKEKKMTDREQYAPGPARGKPMGAWCYGWNSR